MSKTLLITFLELLFLESCQMLRVFWQTLSPSLGYFMVFILLLLPAWATWKRGHHYWVIFKHKARWPRRCIFICLGPLSSIPRNHYMSSHLCISIPNGRYPHCGLYEWNVFAFNHLSTQLALIGLKVWVSMCKLWNPSGISLGLEIP
jgi:hypothetical protein